MAPIRNLASTTPFRRLLVAVLVGVNLLAAAVAAYSLYKSRQQYEARAATLTQNIALAIEQSVANSIETTDLALRAVVDELERQLHAGGIDKAAMTAYLARYEARIRDVEAVRVADADGRVILGKGLDKASGASWADREYFIHLRDHADAGLQVSKPRMGRVAKRAIVGFARRYNHPDGRFAGVVSAPIALDHFAELLSRFDLGRDGTAVLRDIDLGLVTRHPPLPGTPAGTLGNQAVSAELRGLAGAGLSHATFHTTASADHRERIITFRRMRVAPMFAIVGTAREDYLAAWYDEVRMTGSLLAALVLLSGLSGAFLVHLLYRITRESARVKASEEAQRETELILRSAIDTIGEAFVIYDRDDRLIYCNQQYRDYYRASADLLVPGRSFEDIIRIGAERGQYRDAVGRVDAWVAERMAAHRRGDTELIQQLDDDRWLRVLERKTPDGHIVGFRIDVTQLYRAKLAAEAANLAKSQFLATMSHEIRTPMNGVLGMAQLLMDSEVSDADRLDYARTIYTSGKSLLAILNDILDLSKAEAGKIVLERVAFAPDELMHEVAALFAETAHAKGLAIDVVWQDASSARYVGDPVRLRQVLSNLVTNAIKFTDRGFVRIDGEEIGRSGSEALLCFQVADAGIGIDSESRALLFQPFSQADASITRRFGGTGLGLAIANSMTRLLGGDIGVESTPGMGTTFWFTARVEIVDAAHATGASTAAIADCAMTAALAAAGAPEVLVVEDNETNRAVVCQLLNKNGFVVRAVDTGRAAVEALTQGGHRPALILMDIQMPDMDGLEATARIRAWEREQRLPHLPIVALTAGAFREDREKCMEAGMDDFIAKPFSVDDLLGTVGKLTGRRQAEIATSD